MKRDYIAFSARGKMSFKKKRWYDRIVWIGLALWLIETAYFGWNMTAQSGAERVADGIVSIMIFFGIIGSIACSVVESYLRSARIHTDYKLYVQERPSETATKKVRKPSKEVAKKCASKPKK